MSQSTLVALALEDPAPSTRWFDAKSCVVLGEGGIRQVFVGGRLVGAFGTKDYAERNVLLIALSEEPKAHLGHLAAAFEVSTETLRELRILVARDGIEAATRRRRGGSASRVRAPGQRPTTTRSSRPERPIVKRTATFERIGRKKGPPMSSLDITEVDGHKILWVDSDRLADCLDAYQKSSFTALGINAVRGYKLPDIEFIEQCR